MFTTIILVVLFVTPVIEAAFGCLNRGAFCGGALLLFDRPADNCGIDMRKRWAHCKTLPGKAC